ncbi:MAG: CZB domain-containing protein [Candidatus Electrothrix sp. YB6]
MDVAKLQAATIVHLQWKSKLSDFFYGVEELNASQVPDHTHCELGKWLYSSGLQELAELSGTDRLDSAHKEVHNEIKRLVQMPEETRKSAEGKQALAHFKTKCDRLVDILENLEAQAKQQ